jgi:hypothetical protein
MPGSSSDCSMSSERGSQGSTRNATNAKSTVSTPGPKPLDITTIIARNTSLSNGVSYATLFRGQNQVESVSRPANGHILASTSTAAISDSAVISTSTSVLTTVPTNASANAAAAVAAVKLATPELAELAAYLKKKIQADILRYCLGLKDFPDAPPLAKRIIVICFDTEGWTADSAKITEVGFNTFDVRDMFKLGGKRGPHGLNLLKNVYFYHIRVQPNAHLLNIKYCPGDPTANRFGQTRFLTRGETQGCLNDAFGWLLDSTKPELGYCPVILLGHALGGDLDKLQNTLGWSPQSLGNIVKVVDTQQLVRDVGWWDKRDQIGLPAIVARCNFTYRNAHTASNDAAMTTISAITMVLPGAKAWGKKGESKPI